MARVVFSSALQRFTDGVERVDVDARDVRSLIDALEVRFPGLEGRLREGMAVAIDGEIVNDPLLERVAPDSEIHFLPPISGG